MRAATSLATLAAIAAFAVTAHADPSEADRTFELGRQHLALGEYAAACAAFEASQRLDPQLGTRFNIAQCEVGLGKLVEALAIYRDLATRDTNAQRKATSAKLAADLAERVPHIHLRIAHATADLVVTLDGIDVTATADDLAVDVGTHVVVTQQAHARTQTPVEVRVERANFDVAIDAIAVESPPPPQPAPPAPLVVDPPPARPRDHRPVVGFTVGGAAIAGGAVLGLLARSRWNDAQAAAARGDIASANDLSSSASTRGDISTGLFVVGGLAAAAGVVLMLGHHETQVTATPTSVSLRARF